MSGAPVAIKKIMSGAKKYWWRPTPGGVYPGTVMDPRELSGGFVPPNLKPKQGCPEINPGTMLLWKGRPDKMPPRLPTAFTVWGRQLGLFDRTHAFMAL